MVVWAGGRIAEKEEEHAMYEKKMAEEGLGFMGVDAFLDPTPPPRGVRGEDPASSLRKKAGK